MSTIIEKLKVDDNYYGEFGANWLSNSDIGTLINDPKNFGKPKEETKAMVEGRYLHTLMLEPDKASSFQIVQASSRNTNIYKQSVADSGKQILLLQDEADAMLEVASALKQNFEVSSTIYDKGNKFEQPAIGTIMGQSFKGKADIVSSDFLYDLKTTSSLSDFRYSAYRYNYDSQAYIYGELFGKPMKFIVIDKETKMIGVFTASDEFVARGREKVEMALEVYNTYLSPTKKKNISQITIYQTL
jgi:hypothetical protein